MDSDYPFGILLILITPLVSSNSSYHKHRCISTEALNSEWKGCGWRFWWVGPSERQYGNL